MDDVLPLALLGLVMLACPLGMGVLAVGAWLIARARGEERALSVSCREDHRGRQEPPGQTQAGELREEIERLQHEVEALRGRRSGLDDGMSTAAGVLAREEEERRCGIPEEA